MTQWIKACWVPREAALSINAVNARVNAMNGEDNATLWTR